MSSLSCKLRWALVIGKVLVAHASEIEVGRRAWRVLYLAFERVKSIRELFDVPAYVVSTNFLAHDGHLK